VNIDAGGVSSTTEDVLPVASKLPYMSALWHLTTSAHYLEGKNEPV